MHLFLKKTFGIGILCCVFTLLRPLTVSASVDACSCATSDGTTVNFGATLPWLTSCSDVSYTFKHATDNNYATLFTSCTKNDHPLPLGKCRCDGLHTTFNTNLWDIYTSTQNECNLIGNFLKGNTIFSDGCQSWKIPEGYKPDASTSAIPWTPLAPTLAINIPTIKPFTTKSIQTPDVYGDIYIPFIGQYAAGIYKYLILIAGIIAAVRIIAAGFNYIIAGGNAQQIEEAKSSIGHALIGLLIVFGSYSILYFINPALVQFNSLKIHITENVPLTGGDASVGTGDGDLIHGVKIETSLPTKLGINCPGSGGNVASVAQSFVGKVTYQLGGKGYIGTDNTMHMDCSRYVSYVYTCAGYKMSTWTQSLFTNKNVETINSYSAGNPPSVNGTALEPGDLVGWLAKDNKKGVGHVMMYLGDGKFIHNSSMNNGKETGNGVKTFDSNASLTHSFKYILRNKNIVNQVPPASANVPSAPDTGAGATSSSSAWCCPGVNQTVSDPTACESMSGATGAATAGACTQ